MTDPLAIQLTPYIEVILSKKSIDPVVMDVRGLCCITDFFIICTGSSARQVSALAEHTLVELKKKNIRPMFVEGTKEGTWAVIDYGSVIIHIFYEPVRAFYDLEGLWIDAPRIKMELPSK